MIKEFQKDCKSLIKQITKDIDTDLSPLDLLLWIYFNMYFYNRRAGNEGECNENELLKEINGLKDWNIPIDSYKVLWKKAYLLLKDSILNNYSPSSVGLKEMEVLYEGLLLEGVRSKTGAYYTPQPIVHYMVVKSLVAYMENQMADAPDGLEDFILGEAVQIEKSIVADIEKILKEIKIIDLACGGGVFLREALRLIFQLRCKTNEILATAVVGRQLLKEVLSNIYGMDIQPNTVILCKLLLLMECESLMAKIEPTEDEKIEASKEISINHETHLVKDTELNIFCRNSLIHEAPNEEVLPCFDLVIGNPPYIGERGNRQIFSDIKESTFGEKYYEGKMDYFYFFIYKGGEILKKGGVLGLITTNYFVTADGANKLRNFMREHFSFKELINFNEAKVFKDATGQHNMIFIATKETRNTKGPRVITLEDKKLSGDEVMPQLLKKQEVEGVHISTLKLQERLYDDKGQILLKSSYGGAEVLDRITQMFKYTLGDFCHVNQGIVSGADRLTAPWADKLKLYGEQGKGIFVLTEEEIIEKGFHLPPYSSYLKDFYKNSHIKKYCLLKNQGLKILYLDDEEPQDLEQLPKLYQHLERYKILLTERREVKQGSRKWYALQWPRKREIFEGEKIVVPQRSLRNAFAYHEGPWYASADVYYITLKDRNISLKTVLAVLNSSLIYFWLLHRGKRKGEYLELYGTPLKGIPFPTLIELSAIAPQLEDLVEKVEAHISNNIAIDHLEEAINEIVYSLYQLKEAEKECIREFIKERRR
ncbi:Eco57I restriction-modification methylase domain-containing protein [Alkaliphilus hydrothermalis]|uniref:site-specific DNA-methyltransferase (adenine-specific) n=1 Tax=Alkaliphilus hydrothermalis TaxID=1482730 RepID=A0ABS2NSP3_9FIRM|nr:TaqI-like C-terminal specificity domain-containing protein [Alkaliphilus hydrothermalis]MBM7615782.1 adenine-specific DNA-methyltransferase [Alkaliphilus hydrothermalis]